MDHRSLALAAVLAWATSACSSAQVAKPRTPLVFPEVDLDAEPRECAPDDPRATPHECFAWAVDQTERGGSVRRAKARAVFEELCRMGYTVSCITAADVCAGDKDVATEQRYRDEACALGAASQCRDAVAERRARYARSRAQARERCERGEAQECTHYGAFLWDHDRDEAGLAFFDRSCALGDPVGCGRAGAAREALAGRGPW